METQFQFIDTQIRKDLKNWWAPLLIGVLLIVTAIWTFTSPMSSYLALSILFSISFLVSGILEIYFSIANKEAITNWGWNLAFGIITAIVGVMMLINPEISMVTLPLYVGLVILFRSIMAIGWATDISEGSLMILGILGILFAFVLLWNPVFAGMTIVFWTGFSFLISGIFSCYLAFKLRKVYKQVKS